MVTKSQQIKKALKDAGFNSRKVTVRSNGGTLSSSFTVTIRDAEVKKEVVKEITSRFEHIRYCQASGDILGGGNTFIDVRYSEEAEERLAEKYDWILREAVAEMNAENAYLRIGRFQIDWMDWSTVRIHDIETNRLLSKHYHPKDTRRMAIDMHLIEQN